MISYAARYCDKYKPDQTAKSTKSTESQEKEKQMFRKETKSYFFSTSCQAADVLDPGRQRQECSH
jgi:hypothetical protein